LEGLLRILLFFEREAEVLTSFVNEAAADNVSLLVIDQSMGYRQLQ
jgi:hypothetical protein